MPATPVSSRQTTLFGGTFVDPVTLSDAGGTVTLSVDGQGMLSVGSGMHVAGGLTSTGDILVSKADAWLTLHSLSTGDNGTDQAAGISVGESGKEGSASLHLTYTGDGLGRIGMGTVTNGSPAYEALRFAYQDPYVRMPGRLRIGSTATPAHTLDVVGDASITGPLYQGDHTRRQYGNDYVYRSVAHMATISGHTGALKITLPNSWTRTMLRFTIRSASYASTGGAWEAHVYGYNFTDSWIHENAYVHGRAPFDRVRFGHDGTNCVIVLGDTTDVWHYNHIEIAEVSAGYSNEELWGGPYPMAVVSDLTGITFTGDVTPDVRQTSDTRYLRTDLDVTGTLDVSSTATVGTQLDVTGGRPITLDATNGLLTVRGGSLGWATGYRIHGYTGVDLMHFGGYGNGDDLIYAYIGASYDAATAVRIYETGEVRVGGNLAVGQNAAAATHTLDVTGTLAVSGASLFQGHAEFHHDSGIEVTAGVHGAYNEGTGTGTAWGAPIWSIGGVYNGSGFGDAFSPVGQYGVSWFRASHAHARAEGEGLYILQNGNIRAAFGQNGAWVEGTVTAGDLLTADGGINVTGVVDFDDPIGSKLLFYSNTYGIGTESGYLTTWGANLRWRIGGTDPATGVEKMLLTSTKLAVEPIAYFRGGIGDDTGILEIHDDLDVHGRILLDEGDSLSWANSSIGGAVIAYDRYNRTLAETPSAYLNNSFSWAFTEHGDAESPEAGVYGGVLTYKKYTNNAAFQLWNSYNGTDQLYYRWSNSTDADFRAWKTIVMAEGGTNGKIGTDAYARIGDARIGYYGLADMAGFAHSGSANSAGYALAQTSAGYTLINTAAGADMTFRVANDIRGTWNDAGFRISTENAAAPLWISRYGHADEGLRVTVDDRTARLDYVEDAPEAIGQEMILGTHRAGNAQVDAIKIREDSVSVTLGLSVGTSTAPTHTFNVAGTSNFTGAAEFQGTVETLYGLHGAYNEGSGAGHNWANSIWAMGSGWSGTGFGASFVPTAHHGIVWSRKENTVALSLPDLAGNASIGEGMYVYTGGSLRGGIGDNGIYIQNGAIRPSGTYISLLQLAGSAAALRAGSVLASNAYSDATKVPVNGIYSKGQVIANGGLIVGDVAANASSVFHGDLLPGTAYKHNIGALDNKWLTGHLAELWVSTLVASEERSTVGGRFSVGHATTLAAPVTTGATTIQVNHNNLNDGDIIHLEARLKLEFMQVDSSATGSGPYTYTVVRNLDGTGANAWDEGDGVFNTGTVGTQFIDLTAANSLTTGASIGGARLSVYERTGTTYSDLDRRLVLGELNGSFGYTTTATGLAAGDSGSAWFAADATNGFRIMHGSQTMFEVDTAGQAYVHQSVVVGGRGPAYSWFERDPLAVFPMSSPNIIDEVSGEAATVVDPVFSFDGPLGVPTLAVIDNLAVNEAPHDADGLSDWTAWSHYGNASYWTTGTDRTYVDPERGRVYEGVSEIIAPYLYDYYPLNSVTGDVWSMSIDLWCETDQTIDLYAFLNGSGGTSTTLYGCEIGPEWRRFEVTLPATTGTDSTTGFGWRLLTLPAGVKVRAARPSVTKTLYAPAYHPGTPNSELRLPARQNDARGSILMWIRTPPLGSEGQRAIIDFSGDNPDTGRNDLWTYSDGDGRPYWLTAGGNLVPTLGENTPGEWMLVKLTWDVTTDEKSLWTYSPRLHEKDKAGTPTLYADSRTGTGASQLVWGDEVWYSGLGLNYESSVEYGQIVVLDYVMSDADALAFAQVREPLRGRVGTTKIEGDTITTGSVRSRDDRVSLDIEGGTMRFGSAAGLTDRLWFSGTDLSIGNRSAAHLLADGTALKMFDGTGIETVKISGSGEIVLGRTVGAQLVATSSTLDIGDYFSVTPSATTIAGWTLDDAAIVGRTPSNNTDQFGHLRLQLGNGGSPTGTFYSADQTLDGLSMTWWRNNNAGHLVVGQIAEDNSTVKAGYYGLQMMDNAGREYFAAAADTTATTSTLTSGYFRIAGHAFDHESLWTGTKAVEGSYSTAGYTLFKTGAFSSPNLKWDAQGTLSMRGDLELDGSNDYIRKNKTFSLGGGILNGTGAAVNLAGWQATADTLERYVAASFLELTTAGNSQADKPALIMGWDGAGGAKTTGANYITLGAVSYLKTTHGPFTTASWDYDGGGLSINVGGANVLFAGKRGAVEGAVIAGHSFDHLHLWTGTKATEGSFSAAGYTLFKTGAFSSPNLKWDAAGNLSLRGNLELEASSDYIRKDSTFRLGGGILSGTGSSVTLAGWTAEMQALHGSTVSNGKMALMIGTDGANQAGIGGNAAGTFSGDPTLAIVKGDVYTDRFFVSLGETYSGGWTGRTGFSLTRGKNSPALFEVSYDGTSYVAQIAGWDFDTDSLSSGSVELNSDGWIGFNGATSYATATAGKAWIGVEASLAKVNLGGKFTFDGADAAIDGTITARGGTIEGDFAVVGGAITASGSGASEVRIDTADMYAGTIDTLNNAGAGFYVRLSDGHSVLGAQDGTDLTGGIKYNGALELKGTNVHVKTDGTGWLGAEGVLDYGAGAVTLAGSIKATAGGLDLLDGQAVSFNPATRDGNLFSDEGYRLNWRVGDQAADPGMPGQIGTRATVVRTAGPFGAEVNASHYKAAPGETGWLGGLMMDVPTDRTKTYRFVVYFRMEGWDAAVAGNGEPTRFYLGGEYLWEGSSQQVDGNPYYISNWNTSNPREDGTWYAAVALLHPEGWTGPDTGTTGVYDLTTGERVYAGYDSAFTAASAAQEFFRFSMYKTGSQPAYGTEEMFFYAPTIQVVDGTEPSLTDFFRHGLTRITSHLVSSPTLSISQTTVGYDQIGGWLGEDSGVFKASFKNGSNSLNWTGTDVAITTAGGMLALDGNGITIWADEDQGGNAWDTYFRIRDYADTKNVFEIQGRDDRAGDIQTHVFYEGQLALASSSVGGSVTLYDSGSAFDTVLGGSVLLSSGALRVGNGDGRFDVDAGAARVGADPTRLYAEEEWTWQGTPADQSFSVVTTRDHTNSTLQGGGYRSEHKGEWAFRAYSGGFGLYNVFHVAEDDVGSAPWSSQTDRPVFTVSNAGTSGPVDVTFAGDVVVPNNIVLGPSGTTGNLYADVQGDLYWDPFDATAVRLTNGSTALSDARFKRDLKLLDASLVDGLHGYTYLYSDDAPERAGQHGHGVVAQEVETVLPHAVSERGGVKYVDYAQVVPLLVEAVREARGRLAALEEAVFGDR